jgi:hypothetical protein
VCVCDLIVGLGEVVVQKDGEKVVDESRAGVRGALDTEVVFSARSPSLASGSPSAINQGFGAFAITLACPPRLGTIYTGGFGQVTLRAIM